MGVVDGRGVGVRAGPDGVLTTAPINYTSPLLLTCNAHGGEMGVGGGKGVLTTAPINFTSPLLLTCNAH